MTKVLYISPDFNYSCGVSKLVFLYLKYFGSKNGYEIHFVTNGGDSLERLEQIPSLKFKILNFSRGISNILYYRNFYKDVKQYVTDNQIKLIHTHHRFPEFIAVKIAKELNIKTVASAHSFVTGYKGICFKSDKIISVSNSVSSYLLNNFNVKKENILTLYNPIEELPVMDSKEKEILKNEFGINREQKILLFIGRINQFKGCDTLLRSFQLVKEEVKDVVLLMCGSVEDKKFSKASVHRNASVILLKPRRDINALYLIADIIILPSLIESFPFVMIETGTVKKPFIGSNTGGIAEFIEDGKNGLLVNPGNHIELAEKIVYLLKNKDFGKNLGNNLYQKVMEQCDYNNYFFQIEEIYNSLLTSK